MKHELLVTIAQGSSWTVGVLSRGVCVCVWPAPSLPVVTGEAPTLWGWPARPSLAPDPEGPFSTQPWQPSATTSLS